MSKATRIVPSLMVIAMMLPPSLAGAQEFFIYPSKGQSASQQNKDLEQCHHWAVKQTGIDPSMPVQAVAPPPPAPEAPQGGLLRGAARGAAVGAVGGAIGGNAGKGAAIGAATGAMIGGMRRRDQTARMEQEQRNYEQQKASAQSQQGALNAQQRQTYNRAATACLEGRGYTVN
jgi:predicted lipid-binding transport protein (Tim44 family)